MAWILDKKRMQTRVLTSTAGFVFLFSLNQKTRLLVNQGLLVPLFQIDTGQIRLLQNRRADAPLIVHVAVMRLFDDPVALAYDTPIALGAFVANA